MRNKYITYGFCFHNSSEVETNLITNCVNKPRKALWGSPMSDNSYSWKQWCEDNDFRIGNEEDFYYWKTYTIWEMEDAKILKLSTLKDLKDLLSKGVLNLSSQYINAYLFDFKEIKELGYSAVELIDSCLGHTFGWDSMEDVRIEMCMNSWDCNSIVVLNPDDIVIPKDQSIE